MVHLDDGFDYEDSHDDGGEAETRFASVRTDLKWIDTHYVSRFLVKEAGDLIDYDDKGRPKVAKMPGYHSGEDFGIVAKYLNKDAGAGDDYERITHRGGPSCLDSFYP